MQSTTVQVTSVRQLRTRLSALSFRPTIAIVFASTAFNPDEISQVFAELDIDLLGCSSAGEICDGEVGEYSIVCLLMDMKPEWYQSHFHKTGNKTTYQAAYESGAFAMQCFKNPAIIVLSGGLTVDAEQIVYGLKDGAGYEIPMFGGLAADDLKMKETTIFDQNESTSEGICCLIIDQDHIEVKGMTSCGWEAVGATNTITSAQGNILKQINGEPALDVFLRYFGFFDNTNFNNDGASLNTISGQYPLQIIREGGYSILRSPLLGNDDDRSLVLAGGVREGEQFRFSIAPGFEVIDATIKAFSELKQEVPTTEALILFSCKGRHAALGPLINQEISGIFEYWNSPLIGFFSYGEIGVSKTGVHEFHNETCSLVSFREK